MKIRNCKLASGKLLGWTRGIRAERAAGMNPSSRPVNMLERRQTRRSALAEGKTKRELQIANCKMKIANWLATKLLMARI